MHRRRSFDRPPNRDASRRRVEVRRRCEMTVACSVVGSATRWVICAQRFLVARDRLCHDRAPGGDASIAQRLGLRGTTRATIGTPAGPEPARASVPTAPRESPRGGGTP